MMQIRHPHPHVTFISQLNHVESSHTLIAGLHTIGTVQRHESDAELLTKMKPR